MNTDTNVFWRDETLIVLTVLAAYFVTPWLPFVVSMLWAVAWLLDNYILPRVRGEEIDSEVDPIQTGFDKLFSRREEEMEKEIKRLRVEVNNLKKGK